METTLSKKDLTYDGLVWFFLLIFLAMLSLGMLMRDAKKQYGALSFGVFPAFQAVDPDGKKFDEHRLHGQLSAVIVADGVLAEDVIFYLQKLSQVTAMGKKYLTSLILTDQNVSGSNRSIMYLNLSEEGFQKIKNWRKGLFKDGIILVDQNGVIRGVFNLEDKLDRMNFEGAVKGIL